MRLDRPPEYRTFFSPDAPVYAGRAPGRLDVMGGIADYSGATVLQLPLSCRTTVMVQRQAAHRCDIVTGRGGGWESFSMDLEPLTTGALSHPQALAAWFAARDDDRWAAYVIGVVQRCLNSASRREAGASPGFRILIDSDVPEGKGVSSSAALEVASMAAVAESCGLDVPAQQMAADCQWVENYIVGAPCGIMDQMTSACGRSDRLLRLRCQPGTIEGYVEIPSGYRFYGIDSGLRHTVSGADYVTVRTAAFMGYRLIAAAAGLSAVPDGHQVRVDDPIWHGYLANISTNDFASRFEPLLPIEMSGSEFLEKYNGITDVVTSVRPEVRYPVRVATAHPVFEQHRVTRFARLLDVLLKQPEVAIEMGRLMHDSHASYSACGLGSDGTDRLVELVAGAGPAQGLFGAKITGGGSGGTVAVFGTEAAEGLVREIAARYTAETGRPAEVFAESGPGAEETGVEVTSPPVG